jgi:hypothetical protein
VNHLHLTEKPEVTDANFSLTPEIEGVKHTRSLTTSEVFPVGAASGAQAKSPSALQND